MFERACARARLIRGVAVDKGLVTGHGDREDAVLLPVTGLIDSDQHSWIRP